MPEKPPKKRIWDKLLMGAVIGGAIGSVVGATIAPKKGKETRKEIIQAVKNTGKGSKQFFQKLKMLFSFWKKRISNNKQNAPQPTNKHNQIKKIPNEEIAEIEQ